MTNPSAVDHREPGRFQNRAGSPDQSKRFTPNRTKKLHLHPNDQAVVHLVDRCRFLDSRQLRLTIGRGLNPRAFLRRLQQLFHAEYLDRPQQQLNRWWTKGEATKHFVYGLGIEGHKLLYPELHRKGAPTTDWRLRNRRAGAVYMDHRLALSEVMLSFVGAAEGINAQVVNWTEGKEFHQATRLPDYVQLETRTGTVDVPLNPDAHFVLAASDGRREHFFLEVDRGTEPIMRTTWRRTHVYRKLAGYWQLYRGRLAERVGIPSFRVLTVTTSATRIDNMRALARAMDPKQKGSALFLFTTLDQITLDNPGPSLTAPIWFSPVEHADVRALLAAAEAEPHA
ncbi:MAG: replication-relaxation family protein [Deltaproteobacteria bacterium]|nr:replication-relaxation family protein [Deltaproteobacteria bacterium]